MEAAKRVALEPGPHERRGGMLARETLAMVLAGGRGSRLRSLTDWRAKPAVPFGGKFRIIDFALSNCVNAGIRRVGICTQYKAQSLIRHVQRGWSFLDGRFNEFIELLPAQQRVTSDWYKGTADAVYQNIDILRRIGPRLVLVLAGDHVYKMDYRRMLEAHVASGAKLTVACIAVPLEQASSLGVIAVDAGMRVVEFQEKPALPTPMPDRFGWALASMGIYVFEADFLYEELLRDAELETSGHDFGGDLIPRFVREGSAVMAHDFADSCVNVVDGVPYWRDVGTVDAYWEANLDLCHVVPDLNLYDESWPVWTTQEQVPPAKFVFDDEGRRGTAVDSLVCGGCIVSGSRVKGSLLSTNVRVHSYCSIEDSVILPHVDIGRGSVIKRAVIDKNCRLPPRSRVGVDLEEDRKRFYVTPKGVVLVVPEMLGQQVHHVR
jgi:glucose-1-phosphate adenylyltransferase